MLDSTSSAHTVEGPPVMPGEAAAVDLYLDRCQVDTPPELVIQTWALINQRRPTIGCVIDFGAGDGRFARAGAYASYTGYEIDAARYTDAVLPINATMVNACAFSAPEMQASLACGNPPFVRNQDLPHGWRESAAAVIRERTGVTISGLANAWQYFFFLSLASTADDGLVALVIPYEWVSRPSSAALRQYIASAGWGVAVYRLADETFSSVLTTSSITIVDKRGSGQWRYFQQQRNGQFVAMTSPSGAHAVLDYRRAATAIRVKRGLSPGTQDYLTLTEQERLAHRLRRSSDVVPCVTTLRPTSGKSVSFTQSQFEHDYVHAGAKCWLIRTDRVPSPALQAYLNSVPHAGRSSSTCQNREVWWAFKMPVAPKALVASGFRERPKIVMNAVGAVAVGSVYGLYAPSKAAAERVVRKLRAVDYHGRVVAHSNGLHKLEPNQLNALIGELDGSS